MQQFRFAIFSVMLLSVIAGSLLAQTDDPVPTATLSPRGIEGIFQTLRINYGLEIDNNSESFPSSVEVEDFINSFAFSYLNVSPQFPYAVQIGVIYMGYDQYDRLLSTVSAPAARSIYTYLSEALNHHTIMASVGLHKEGFAIVYTERCHSPMCSTASEYSCMFRQNAVGVFVTYVKDAALNSDESLALLLKTYPRLASDLEIIPTEDGFVVRGTRRTPQGEEIPLLYYGGTRALERDTAVYVVVAIGKDFTRFAIPDF